jgi:hypothetical protein
MPFSLSLGELLALEVVGATGFGLITYLVLRLVGPGEE